MHTHCAVPPAFTSLLDAIKQRDQYIGQFEMFAAIVPYISLPPEWFEGYDVEHWIDNTGAIGAFVESYSGVPDCARIVNLFRFATAKLKLRSIWIDYVNSESNIADVPSRALEPSAAGDEECLEEMGTFFDARLPIFSDDSGSWLPFVHIARSAWPAI